ncbi:MAG: RNA pyrophosphohydrolase [Alphaproteobacteria bacterium]
MAKSHLPYRPCVGVMLVNAAGLIWVGRRIDTPNGWQMPQGGIDTDEEPKAAALRELHEETGIRSVEIVAESNQWLDYDYPATIARHSFATRFRGQRQKWFAMRFLGQDVEIDLGVGHAEFNAWKWCDINALADLIVDFKRPVYEAVVHEFQNLAR